MAGAFEGYKILDFTEGLAGPFVTMRLADAGANVIKVEQKAGDISRTLGPTINGESALYLGLNRNKRCIALDHTLDQSREIIARLLSDADVVVADRLSTWPGDIDYAAVAAIKPDIVYCSISAFGDEGPLKDAPGSELTVQAMTDYTNSLGVLGESPVRVGTDIAHLNTGIFASQAIAAALYHRARTGAGQYVSVSLLGSLIHLRGLLWTCLSNPDEWFGVFNDHYTRAPEHGYRTTDGQVYWGLRRGDSEDWDRLLLELGLFEYADDPRFAGYGRQATSIGRFAPEVKPIWEKAFAEQRRTMSDVITLVHSVKGDAVPFSDYPSLVSHPQVAAVKALHDIQHPTAGPIKSVSSGWEYSGTPTVSPLPAPAFGQHGREILMEAGFGDGDIQRYRQCGAVV